MLQQEAVASTLEASVVAYIVYDAKDRVVMHDARLMDLFPAFEGRDLIGLHRGEVRDLLKEKLGERGHEVDKLNALTREKRLTSDLGIFELSGGSFYALDDLALPDGGTLTLIRDLTRKKHDLDIVLRLEAALLRLAKEEAIYNGEKQAAYDILTEIACKALGADRTGVWLLNVDGTALHSQQTYWAPDGSYHALDRLDRVEQPALFEALDGGKAIQSGTAAEEAAFKGLIAGQVCPCRVGSLLLVPILRGPRTIGAVIVGQEAAGHEWRQAEVSFVSYVADLVLRMLEAHDRHVAEEGLRGFNEMLEARVKSRTRELEDALENLKLAQDELVRSEKMASLGALVAGVAHEINTPLGVALTTITHMGDAAGRFETLVESGKIRRSDLTDFLETTREATSVTSRNLERAAHLVRSFKMVAVDQAMDDARDLDIGDYLGEIVDSLKPTLRKQGVTVRCHADEGLVMRTVPGDLSHVLTNLIMNAALHAFRDCPDGADKRVEVSAVRQPDALFLEVSDNGRGIPEDIRSKIFDPFFTTARDKGGSGLGLNIVYNTVYQKMKGSIDVGDAPGGGTRFAIRLPYGAGE